MYKILHVYYMRIYLLLSTSFNPQNLRNIIRKAAKISINQIIIELVCQSNRILLFFWYPTNFTGLGLRLVVDINIITKLSKTFNFCIFAINIPKLIRNQHIDKLAQFQF